MSRELFLSHSKDNRQGWLCFGRNARKHGHEFFLLVSDDEGSGGTCIPQGDRRKVARFLRAAANRLDPPPRKAKK